MGHSTKVDFKIRDNYEVTATFLHHDTTYNFPMKKWAKTRDTVVNAASSFNRFADLVLARFGDCSDFGTRMVEQLSEKEVKFSTVRSDQQTINILKYATMDVFTCAEQIITKHRRSVLDYAIHHRELNQQATYQEYIHLVACHCLVHSNFHAPNVVYAPVDFCTEEEDYKPDRLLRIKSKDAENEDEGEDV